jgi:hypothetical protein
MAKKKNKNKPAPVRPLKPETYFGSGQVRRLPFHEAWVNPNWRQLGFATVLVARRHVNGNFAFAGFLIDVFCLGIKDTLFSANEPIKDYLRMIEIYGDVTASTLEKIDYNAAHNFVFGALAYAEDLGFEPNPDFAYSQFILEEDTEDFPLIEYEFGRDGMPVYFPGPSDNYDMVLRLLKENAGDGNFDVLLPDGNTYLDSLHAGRPFGRREIVEALREHEGFATEDDGEWDDEEDWEGDEEWDEEEDGEGVWVKAEEVQDPEPQDEPPSQEPAKE